MHECVCVVSIYVSLCVYVSAGGSCGALVLEFAECKSLVV